MTSPNNFHDNRHKLSDRPVAGPLELALTEALQRSLTAVPRAVVPISAAILKPLGLLPRRMLLVGEDEPLKQSALDLLARWDIPVQIATSGADAVQAVAKSEFDLILIDAKKSVLDGVFLSTRVRQIERMRNERESAALVARVSGKWPATEAVLRMAGVNDVLKVDTGGDVVVECLRRWCSGNYRIAA